MTAAFIGHTGGRIVGGGGKVKSVIGARAGPETGAELTHYYRHLQFGGLKTTHGIGADITRGAYGIELVANLVDQVKAAVDRASRVDNKHPDIEAARQAISSGAVRIIGNIAPRSSVTQPTNGSHFHLAILDNGVEVYATPLEILKYVREFNGTREQILGIGIIEL